MVDASRVVGFPKENYPSNGSMGMAKIHLHEWLICVVNNGKCIYKYTIPMDPVGMNMIIFYCHVSLLESTPPKNSHVEPQKVGCLGFFGSRSFSFSKG